MPVHALEVDRSFISRMVDDPMSAAIVQTVLALAATLGKESIAEGVETEEQANMLRAMKCAAGQGYPWWRPNAPSSSFDRARRALREDRAGAWE